MVEALGIERSDTNITNRSRQSARSGRSSKFSKVMFICSYDGKIILNQYTKASEADDNALTRPQWDYDTDIEVEKSDSVNEYDSNSSARRLYQNACRMYGTIPVSYFLRNSEQAELKLDYHQIGPLGARAIAVALTCNTKILSFSVRDNGIGSEGALAMAEMFTENNYIQAVDFSENDIGKLGSDAIFLMLEENTTLEDVLLEKCCLGNDAIQGMTKALADSQKITNLNLSGNKFSDSQALGQVIAENASLKSLNLRFFNVKI